MDGESFEDIETKGLQEWLNGLGKELHDKTYRPQPVRRVMIPKPGGGERPLGYPDHTGPGGANRCEIDAGTDLRGGSGAECLRLPAAEEVRRMQFRRVENCCARATRISLTRICRNTLTRIPHSELMQCVARRIVDKQMLHLMKMWLKVPVEERDENGKRRRLTGGKDNDRGTPQGGVISPLLANLYMNRMLKGWRQTGRGEQFRAQIVNLRGRFRDSQSRQSERGTGVDAWGAEAAGTDSEREEDEHPERPAGAIRFSGLHIRAALQCADGAGVYRIQSVEEERATDQGKSGRHAEGRAMWHRGKRCATS